MKLFGKYQLSKFHSLLIIVLGLLMTGAILFERFLLEALGKILKT